jgi:protein O-mannosyl-transferase
VTRPPHLLFLVLLGAVALAAYTSSFNADLVQDSKARVLEDPRVRDVTADNVRHILTEDYWWPLTNSGLYRPVTTASYLFNYAVLGNGVRPQGYHWVNFLVHFVNATLVYLLAQALFARAAPAFFTAALFAVHPAGVETITNVAGRPDLLAASFVLGGLLIYLGATRNGRDLEWRPALGVALAGFLGCLCKENAAVLLPLIVVLDLSRSSAPWRLRARGYLWLAFAILAWLCLRQLVLGTLTVPRIPFVDNPLAGADFWTAKMTAFKVLGRSLWLLFWPRTLSCDYSYDQIPLVSWRFARLEDLEAVAALAVVLGALAGTVYLRRRNQTAFFFVAFVFVTILPTSNLVVPIGTIMAERFLYLPIVGYVACLVALIDAVCRWSIPVRADGPGRSFHRNEWLATAILTVVLLGYAGRTYARNGDWTSELELWRSAVLTSPNSYKPHLALAYLLYREDPARNIDVAIREAETAAAIIDRRALPAIDVPLEIFAHLGAYYSTKGDQLRRPTPDGSFVTSEQSRPWYEKAVAELTRAVAIDSALNEAHHREQRQRGRRLSEIPEVSNHDLYDHLGMAESRLGRYRKAIEAWNHLLRLAPTRVDVHVKVAAALRLDGRNPEALVALHESWLLDRQNAEIPKMLVTVYQESDVRGCAIRLVDGRPELNPLCAAVEGHRCQASRALVRLFEESKQFVSAEWMRRRTIEEQHCRVPGS